MFKLALRDCVTMVLFLLLIIPLTEPLLIQKSPFSYSPFIILLKRGILTLTLEELQLLEPHITFMHRTGAVGFASHHKFRF